MENTINTTSLALQLRKIVKRKVRATELNEIAPKLNKEFVKKCNRSPGSYMWSEADIPEVVRLLNE